MTRKERRETDLMFPQLASERADKVGASPRDLDHPAEVQEHDRLSREEVYPKVEDRDGVRLDQLAVGLVGCRQERKGVVAGRDAAEVPEPRRLRMFCPDELVKFCRHARRPATHPSRPGRKLPRARHTG